MSDVKEALTSAGFSVAWSAVKTMPEPMAYGIFQRVADRTWEKRGKGVTRLESNLARVLPDRSPDEIRELSRAGMRSYLRYWCDVFRLPAWSHERILDSFRLENGEVLDDAIAQGRGVMVALSHMGNWDHAGAWGALKYGSIATVAERLEPTSLFDKFVAFRESLGIRVYPLGAREAPIRLRDHMRDGGLVCLLADRDLSGSGVPVTFFGGPTKIPAGPARLALAAGAPLLTASLRYDGDVTVATINEVIEPPGTGDLGSDISIMAQQVATSFEAGILRSPADWHMLQRVWLDDERA